MSMKVLTEIEVQGCACVCVCEWGLVWRCGTVGAAGTASSSAQTGSERTSTASLDFAVEYFLYWNVSCCEQQFYST